ncbi:MAG: enoyl-CoA hydratase [Solirubrobacteraceae bacterium]|jgi:enoyl-CoA hydratase/carnithine racemase|nr:enoyl-CoA hydratase [Solirubrobacteraceae bacterium]MEA2138447.1 enoyl-CoA hydratase [Solirubrobacteraceae bacterium]
MAGTLLIDRPREGVLRLSISNPCKRNALDLAILDAIATALGSLDGARCVVLTGSDGVFSAGYDIGAIAPEQFASEAQKLVAHPFSAALTALDEAQVPTLAALGGSAIGGGLELALGCDLRIASGAVKLGMPPAKLGLTYSHTGLRRFLDAIGEPRTRELFLLGRYIDAQTALSWGLVNWVVPHEDLDDAALALAAQLAANAPLAMAGNKRVLRELLRAEATIDPDVERELLQLRESSFASHDLREGVSAFAEKRAPSWKGC